MSNIKNEMSPMMKHYLQVKEQYPDCILFYRLGDFYEFFYEDAIKMSEELDLTLTGKQCGLEEKAPMCGIPHHAAEGYIAKLVSYCPKTLLFSFKKRDKILFWTYTKKLLSVPKYSQNFGHKK